MAQAPLNIETAFSRLAEIAGFEGILFMSGQGSILASRFVGGEPSAGVAEHIASIIKDIEEMAKKISSHGLEEITVKGGQRNLLFLKGRQAGFMAVVLGKESMHIGLARLKMKETVEELDRTVGELLAGKPKGQG